MNDSCYYCKKSSAVDHVFERPLCHDCKARVLWFLIDMEIDVALENYDKMKATIRKFMRTYLQIGDVFYLPSVAQYDATIFTETKSKTFKQRTWFVVVDAEWRPFNKTAQWVLKISPLIDSAYDPSQTTWEYVQQSIIIKVRKIEMPNSLNQGGLCELVRKDVYSD